MLDKSAHPIITLELTPETIRVGGRILSEIQGCEDPLAQREYCCDLFKELMEELLQKGVAASAS